VTLPVEEAVAPLLAALRTRGRAVLQAPPGAGKTTRVPLALLDAGAFHGRLVMLEPRRLAARAAAERMAETLGEGVGGTVGYRIRGEARVGPRTRIEVVTEGILTRMIQSDPGLSGIGMLVFDEFHERSLNADLGLALALEAAGALRDDLKLLVMSATLDAGPVAALMGDAPVITSEGRAWPVETRWCARPRGFGATPRLAVEAAELTLEALEATEGGVLVFLPGAGEIRRAAAHLAARLPEGVALRPLHGAMPFAEQRAALAPEPGGARKLVLATAIAETSLTIEGIRVVVDAGRARRARFDAASGMTRLVTEPVSRAEADQRRGRAGRVAPGICYRMWAKAEEGALPAHAPPEIATADLAGLALELAVWGARGAGGLALLDPPHPGAFAEARRLLADLGALDAQGAVTAHGRAMAGLPLHPRLAHMLLTGGADAPLLAALLAERDPLPPDAPADLTLRREALADPAAFAARRPWVPDGARLARIRDEARRLPKGRGPRQSLAGMAARAYPDRIGLRRKGAAARFVLSGGRGAVAGPGDTLGAARLIVATDLDGAGAEARIRQGVAITEAELRGLFAERIEWVELCRWSRRHRRVKARRQERLGALVLDDRAWRGCPPERLAGAALEGVRDLGLGALDFSRPARLLQARVEFLRAQGEDMPDFSDAGLLAEAEAWLLPFLAGCRTADDLARLDLHAPLAARLGHEQRQRLDRLAPAQFTAPTGTRVAIDYGPEGPEIAIRLQEMFGLTEHPCVGPTRLPLRITLLSPAQRPLQVTSDLPGFWAASYADVRRDMRGRYPRHPWPENPAQAAPTRRAKPRA